MSLLVVGAGPAGIAAALQARELGAEVTLLDADVAGGTSLNRGPAPVRTLARAARLMRDWSSWARFGLEGDAPTPNLVALLANSARVARYARDKKDVAGHLRHQGIDLIEGLGPVFFAVGWLGNIDELGLETAGVRTERHAIPVDGYVRTNVEHIFAVGDVNGRSMRCRPPDWRVALPRKTPLKDRPGRLSTTWSPAQASPTPNTAALASPRHRPPRTTKS
jgi:pyruvate/2-oxoglutarate dehydrogenase complex dihydrolipoamide dehydrogenase (E3) component